MPLLLSIFARGSMAVGMDVQPTVSDARIVIASKPGIFIYLFRPAGVDVPIVEPGSPFAKLKGVVSEYFFTAPDVLYSCASAVYGQLRAWYRQDPLTRLAR